MNILVLLNTLFLVKLFCRRSDVAGSCYEYESLDGSDFHQRRSSYIKTIQDLFLCDLNIKSGTWYRFGDNKLPEYCPTPSPPKCGTDIPIWMNGSHPTDNVPVLVEACSSYNGNCCMWSDSIQVQRCENITSSGTFYYVYQLAPVTDCASAYCLDIICPSGQVTHHTLVYCVDMYPDVGRVSLAWLGDEGDRRVTCSISGSDNREGALYESRIAVDDRVTGDYVAINDTATFNVAVNAYSQRITCFVRSYWRFSPQSKSSETASNVLSILPISTATPNALMTQRSTPRFEKSSTTSTATSTTLSVTRDFSETGPIASISTSITTSSQTFSFRLGEPGETTYDPTFTSYMGSHSPANSPGSDPDVRTTSPVTHTEDDAGFQIAKHVPAIVVPSATLLTIMPLCVCCVCWRRRKVKKGENNADSSTGESTSAGSVTHPYTANDVGLVEEIQMDTTAGDSRQAPRNGYLATTLNSTEPIGRLTDRGSYNGTSYYSQLHFSGYTPSSHTYE